MIHDYWRKAKVVSLFKKGDRNYFGNCRVIITLNAAYETYSKILNKLVRNISSVLILEEHAGFRTGRSYMDNIEITLKMIIRRRENSVCKHTWPSSTTKTLSNK
jgi:hypothetical protein